MTLWHGTGYADTVYLNGRIWPGAGVPAAPPASAPEPTALATAAGRVLAHGSDARMRELAGPGTTVIDLQGRRVIPGLIDGHLHAARAGATWTGELHWTGVPDVQAALAAIGNAAGRVAPGEWIRAIGGWHPCQFIEAREPTRAELDKVAPDHPVYLQALYEVAILNSAAIRASGLDKISGDPPGGHVERDPGTGEPTGRVHGMGAFTFCLQAAGAPGPAQRLQSTAGMFACLHASGLTGIVDPGGFGMTPESYDTLFELWRRGKLSMRMRLFLSAAHPGQEYAELDAWLRHAQSRFGDEMLRYTGIGEVVHFGCHDFEGLEDFSISGESLEELRRISYRTAERGWPMNIHAVTDESITAILDCWESVNEQIPLTGSRFSLSHADQISARNVGRLRALGGGIVLDDHQVFKGAVSAAAWGSETMSRVPPLADITAARIPLAAGTDATRASSYNPWLSLWWLITGASLDGVRHRADEHLASREQALEWYTAGSAWLSSEESDRGHLRPGARADLAVLSEDYFTVAEDRIPAISSELTVVGGGTVHSAGTVG
jgi:predicted amidohydrolase YtcJ